MGYFKTRPPEGSREDVVQQVCPQVADVGVIVHCGPAAVKAYLARREGFKNLLAPRKGVEKNECHYLTVAEKKGKCKRLFFSADVIGAALAKANLTTDNPDRTDS
jgi:hypothetical protein